MVMRNLVTSEVYAHFDMPVYDFHISICPAIGLVGRGRRNNIAAHSEEGRAILLLGP